jgi:hypothetical protein
MYTVYFYSVGYNGDLSLTLEQFKKRLKTHLFNIAFNIV